MGSFSKLILTRNGLKQINESLTSDKRITFTEMVSSSHLYTKDELGELTELMDIKQHAPVRRIEISDDKVITVDSVFKNEDDNLKEGYFIRTVGLYSTLNGNSTILFAVCIENSDTPAYMPAHSINVTAVQIKFKIKLDNTENINITVDSAGMATISDVMDATAAMEAMLQENINEVEESINGLQSDKIDEAGAARLIAEELAKIVANAPEDFDTLKEISDWISTHQDSAAAMNSIINELKGKLENFIIDKNGNVTTPGNLTSNGDIKTTGSNKLHAGAKVRAWTDNEGGNIEIESADGINIYQMDALNGAFRIYQCVSGTPEYFPLVIKEKVIKAISLELSEALKVAKKGEIGNMLVYKDTSSSSIFYIGGVGASANSYPHLKVTQFSNSFQILPTVSGKITIGHTDVPFEAITAKNIYNSSGLITSSDRNKKKDFKVITQEFAGQVIDGLNPTSFKYKDGDSGRTHYGMVAQDIEKLLKELGIDSKDFAPLVKEYPKKEVENEDGSISLETDYEAEPEYFLRYEGFIGLIIKYIQGLKQQNAELEDKMSRLGGRLEILESKLSNI